MTSAAGWYIGRIETASVASAKAGGSTSVSDTVFHWPGAVRPTVGTANITGLTAIVGGPYATQAAATAAATGDKNTTTATAGTGTSPGVGTSTVNSSNGSLPNPLAAIGDFLARLADASTWVRVAKVVVGGALLLIGLAHITGADNAVAAAARKAPLPV